MKKITAIVLILVMLLSLMACSGTSGKKDSYTVGICQLVQHDALDAATEGFKAALTEKLGDKVTFEEKNASGDSNACATIVNGFVSSNVDLIMANATAALQAAREGTADIPVWALRLPTMLRLSRSITGPAPSAATFRVPPIWLLWISRQR